MYNFQLSLRELESFTGTFLSVFLTLFLTRIACDESGLFERAAEVRVIFHQRTGDPVADRTGLPGSAAAKNVDENVELINRFSQLKRLTDDHLQCLVREICDEIAFI